MKPYLVTAAFAAVLVSPTATLGQAQPKQATDPGQIQLAQVEVRESSPLIRAIGQPRVNPTPVNADTGSASGNTNMQSELFYQLQILQEEVQMLRGLVEEQSYQIQQLKQQRMDDYVDLDRRISQLSQSGSGSSTGSASGGAANGASSSSASSRTSSNAANDEFASYSAAVDLATTRQEFDRAIAALNEHLKQYPDGRYAPNAHYWLGQIYFVQGNMEKARESFTRVVDNYPDHNKTAEATYKLGQVHFRLGDKAKARTLLEQVAQGKSDSAPLAKNFLQQNY